MKILKLFNFLLLIICYIYVMRYTKYKKIIKVSCFGDADLQASKTDSVNKTNSTFNNSKRCRYSLNGALYDILLSKNARLVLESAYIPSITNLSNYVNVRIVTSTQDINVDATGYNSRNPILFTTKSNLTVTPPSYGNDR